VPVGGVERVGEVGGRGGGRGEGGGGGRGGGRGESDGVHVGKRGTQVTTVVFGERE